MAITELPTKTDASIGRVKSDRTPVGAPSPDLAHDVPADEFERMKDAIVDLGAEVGKTDGSTPGSLREATENPATGDPNLIWAWNGVDLTQWRNGGTPELDGTGGALLTISSFRGQVNLRFTGGGSFAYAQWVIDPAEFPDGMPERYVLEVIYDQMDNGAGVKNPIGTECGVSHFCRYNSPNNVRAYSLAQFANGNAMLQIWARDTTMSNSGSTPSGAEPGIGDNRGSTHRYQVTQEHGTPFAMYYQGKFQALGGPSGQSRSGGGGGLDFDSGGFDGIVPNTIGVAYRDNVGQSSWCEISSIRMLKHPADAV